MKLPRRGSQLKNGDLAQFKTLQSPARRLAMHLCGFTLPSDSAPRTDLPQAAPAPTSVSRVPLQHAKVDKPGAFDGITPRGGRTHPVPNAQQHFGRLRAVPRTLLPNEQRWQLMAASGTNLVLCSVGWLPCTGWQKCPATHIPRLPPAHECAECLSNSLTPWHE